MRCGSRTRHTFKAAVSDENPSYGGPAQDASIPQRAIARDLRRPRHKHTVPVARDLEVLAAEDHTTTIDTVDGDITIMRIQLLTVVSLLLLSPRGTPRRPENRTIAFALLAPMPGTSTSATPRSCRTPALGDRFATKALVPSLHPEDLLRVDARASLPRAALLIEQQRSREGGRRTRRTGARPLSDIGSHASAVSGEHPCEHEGRCGPAFTSDVLVATGGSL